MLMIGEGRLFMELLFPHPASQHRHPYGFSATAAPMTSVLRAQRINGVLERQAGR